MENTSQLVLRNAGRLPEGPLALVNPARDALAVQLAAAGHTVSVIAQDYGDLRWFQQAERIAASFETVPAPAPANRTVLLGLPREKDRLEMSLAALACGMDPEAALWLVGENRAGIKSAGRYLQRHFGSVLRLDSARHCGLYEASGPLAAEDFELDRFESRWAVDFDGREVHLASLPGVFAHGRLDKGTQLLLSVLESLRLEGDILDFACGCGVIGLCLLARDPSLRLTLLDSSALALESCRRSLRDNGLVATVLPSEGLSEARGSFDWIVSNPPFHRGIRDNRETAQRFFQQAGTRLAEDGRLLVVYNRHLPYIHWLQDSFSEVRTVADDREFYVVEAARPKNQR